MPHMDSWKVEKSNILHDKSSPFESLVLTLGPHHLLK
jgi:hypothetical protein